MIFPPYCDICSVTFLSEQYNKSIGGANTFFQMLKDAVTNEYTDVKINVLGPIQPRVNKISNKYRHVLTIKCKNNKRFREMMSKVLAEYMRKTQSGGATAVVDINPL